MIGAVGPMAHIALIVIAVDGLWRRIDLVPDQDRVQVHRAALAGLQLALLTHHDEDALREVRWMLRLDPVLVFGAGHRAERKGRVVVESASAADLLDALSDDLSRWPYLFCRGEVLVIGGDQADRPLLAAAGVGVWVPSDGAPPPEADLVSAPLQAGCPGVAQAIESVALRNNRFLRPGAGAGQRFTRL